MAELVPRYGHLARNFKGQPKTKKEEPNDEDVKPKVESRSPRKTKTNSSKYKDYLVIGENGYDEDEDEDPDDPDYNDESDDESSVFC